MKSFMNLLDAGEVKQIIMIIFLLLCAIFCLRMTSNEIIVGNSEPIDINTDTVEQI